MGYYYTAEPEAAVPPKSWATPKTHVPGSPVKERGHRYLMPEIGRWASRDSIGEDGGILLYAFVINQPTLLVDMIGQAPNRIPGFDAGFEVWAEAFWAGQPDWDTRRGVSFTGGTMAGEPQVEMEIEGGVPSARGIGGEDGCFLLSLGEVTMRVDTWWSRMNTTVQVHELNHVADFHVYAFRGIKAYAETKAVGYATQEEAECWKSVVESVAPYTYYLKALAASVERDRGRSSYAADKARYTAALREREAYQTRVENECANQR